MSTSVAPDPSRIFAEFEGQPPLMRSRVMTAYVGTDIEWPVVLADAREEAAGQVHVVFQPDAQRVRLIVGDVSLVEYPQLSTLRVGERVRVRGKIRSISMLSIELEIKQLIFA